MPLLSLLYSRGQRQGRREDGEATDEAGEATTAASEYGGRCGVRKGSIARLGTGNSPIIEISLNN